MLVELGIKVPTPITMFCDNEAAVTLAAQEQINVLGRTKYFNRQIWQIHEVVTSGLVKPTWTASQDMDSDMGTKALMGSNFDRVSNRSFSRMHEYTEVKSDAEQTGGSAKNKNNQFTSPSVNSISEGVTSNSTTNLKSKIATPKRGGPSGRSRPAVDDSDMNPGKLGGGR